MIEQTIQQIEARLKAAGNLTPETRAELMALVAKLREEAVHLPAPSVPVAASGEADEVRTLQEDVTHLRRSVEEFEDSHPRLVQAVNHLASTLSGLGI